MDEVVELRLADAVRGLGVGDGSIDLVFLDAEKDVYERLLDPIVVALRHGGLLVADNLNSHERELAGFRDRALRDPRLSGLVVPIGRGELIAVRTRRSARGA